MKIGFDMAHSQDGIRGDGNDDNKDYDGQSTDMRSASFYVPSYRSLYRNERKKIVYGKVHTRIHGRERCTTIYISTNGVVARAETM